MHPTTWKASGHVDAFNDPLIDNKDSKKRFRADVLIEDYCAKLEEKAQKEIEKAQKDLGKVSTKISLKPPIRAFWNTEKSKKPFSEEWRNRLKMKTLPM